MGRDEYAQKMFYENARGIVVIPLCIILLEKTRKVMTKKQIYSFSLLTAIAFILINYLVFTQWYGYIVYILLGINIFFLSEYFGKEVYFFTLFPIITISVNILDALFISDYYNLNGLNPLKLHPFTVLWLTIFSIEIVIKIIKRDLKFDNILVFSVMTIVLFGALTVFKRGMSGLPQLVENYLGPISFFLYIYTEKSLRWEKTKKI